MNWYSVRPTGAQRVQSVPDNNEKHILGATKIMQAYSQDNDYMRAQRVLSE
jgi:hypothetical protein